MSKIVILFSSLTMAAFAMAIVGTGTGPNSTGVRFEINPVTGAVTSTGTGPNWIPTSASGTPGAYFAVSPVNPYLVSYPSMTGILHCTDCPFQSSPWFTADTAYDFSTASLYAVATSTSPGGGSAMLARIGIGAEQSYPGGSFRPLSVSVIGGIPGGSNSIIEAVPGVGIVLTTGQVAFVIDPTTGAVLRSGNFTVAGGLPFQFLPPVTSLAYDPDTGRLLAATGSYSGGQSTQMIYRIDPGTFEVTVLNANAPNIHGMAAINNYPEPAGLLLIGTGLAALWIFRRQL